MKTGLAQERRPLAPMKRHLDPALREIATSTRATPPPQPASLARPRSWSFRFFTRALEMLATGAVRSLHTTGGTGGGVAAGVAIAVAVGEGGGAGVISKPSSKRA